MTRPATIPRSLGRKQRGMSIVQVMFGILVGSLFLYVAVTQYQDSMKKSRIETASQEVIQMIASSQRVYGFSNQYGQVTTAIAVKGGIVPEHRRNAGTDTAQNNYNGTITFAPETINTTSDSLNITFNNVRPADCQQLVQTTESLARKILVNSTEVKPADGVTNLSALSTSCDQSSPVSVSWVIARG